MKNSVVYSILIAFVLAIISFMNIDGVVEFFNIFFKNTRIHFISTSISGPFDMALKLSLAIGLIPILVVLTWIKGNIVLFKQRFLSVFIVIGCITICLAVNIFRIQSVEMQMTALPAQIFFPLERLYIEYAILIGTILGCLLSYLIYRKRK
jgi:hypothetical protein